MKLYNIEDESGKSIKLNRLMAMLRRFLKYLFPYWRREVILMLMMVFGTAVSLYMPYLSKMLVDDVFPKKDFDLLVKIVATFFGVGILGLAISFYQNYLYTWVSNHILLDMRKDLFNHLIRLPLSFFHKNKTGDIVHRINNEVNTIQSIIKNSIARFIQDVLLLVGLTIALSLLNWELFLLSITIMPFLFLNVVYFTPRIRRITKKVRMKNSEILSHFMERFENVKLIQSFNQYEFENNLLIKKLKELITINIHGTIIGSTTGSVSGFLGSLVPLFVWGYGGWQIINDRMTLGTLIVFSQYLARLFGPFRDLMSLYVDLLRASVSMERIIEFLNVPIQKFDNSKKEFSFANEIKFEDISFGYNGVSVLNDFSLTLKKGKKYALVGASGCGKSTVINLLCQFYSPLEGKIFIDDTPIEAINLINLRKQIGLVSQESFLFQDTVDENIRYGNLSSNSERITDAARFVYAESLLSNNNHNADLDANNLPLQQNTQRNLFIRPFLKISQLFKTFSAIINVKADEGPNNDDELIGERGSKLSGGQKQRIAIARTLLKNSEILILDEATSALDSESEKAIFDNLCQLYSDKTMILISHRLSAIKDVDEIICMNQGTIVEKGSHHKLLARKGHYWNLFKEQIET